MAVDFDGSNDLLNCGSNANLDNLYNADMSLAFWMQADKETAGFCLLGKWGGTPGWLLHMYDGGDATKMNFCQSRVTMDGGWTSPAGSIVTAAWIHFVITFNGSSTANDPIFYKNGVLVATTEVSTPAGAARDDSALNLYVGSSGAGDYYNGRMEDVRVFNRIITPSEVTILAAGYRGPMGGELLW
ncbi:MAG: LamG domain-containing protein, partial [Dehalococcoidales bacterium]